MLWRIMKFPMSFF
ncbi:hypothetical protein B4U80_04878 [Leptotrombidium deliense]|uniref:Uncharacterized protein n=1 Tax=Leptotrombidium deliense TaxID=299467 RepID=A0A443RU12_9ACAR|nr:hypothetical protein B4U80_04878 [Leptotrombidium deliense]